jgi:hypothetical protein
MFTHSIVQGYNTDAGSVKSVITQFTGQTANANFKGVFTATKLLPFWSVGHF